MTAPATIGLCDSIESLSSAMHTKRLLLKEQISSLPDGSGLKVILMAQLDKLAMALKDIDRTTEFIAAQVRRHQNSSAA